MRMNFDFTHPSISVKAFERPVDRLEHFLPNPIRGLRGSVKYPSESDKSVRKGKGMKKTIRLTSGISAIAVIIGWTVTMVVSASAQTGGDKRVATPVEHSATPKGVRVFYASHSLMWYVPKPLGEMAPMKASRISSSWGWSIIPTCDSSFTFLEAVEISTTKTSLPRRYPPAARWARSRCKAANWTGLTRW